MKAPAKRQYLIVERAGQFTIFTTEAKAIEEAGRISKLTKSVVEVGLVVGRFCNGARLTVRRWRSQVKAEKP